MIEIKNLALQRGTKVLLDDASLTIKPHTRIGLIGANGSGKSSLFSLIKGEINADKGDINLPKHWLIASVAQETPALDKSALEYVLDGDQKLREYEQALKKAEETEDGEQIAYFHQELAHIDAYTAPSRAAKLLDGLGFSQNEHQQSVKSFSGGWRMRLNLAQALMCRADLLLLDEPTNHLDLETVLWLEEYLKNVPTTQIIISHDKDFLNITTTHIAELSNQKLALYTGNYERFEEARALKLSQQQNAYQKQQQQIAHLESFINRFKAKATKATQAQSRMKVLEKLQRIAPAHLDAEFTFEFALPTHLPNPLLKMEQVNLGYEHTQILNNINLSIESGARLGLLGVNGSGKSTLIKALSGSLKPLSGQIITSEKLNIGYFAQHQLDTLRDDQSPIWHIQTLSPDVREQEIRNFLGGFNFMGEMALAPIAPFSGGEKARLALAMLVWQKPNLLLLDEPTNHLDLNLRHALTIALQSYTGALILVSHDRSLLEATTDAFLLVQNGQVTTFDGDLHAYRQLRLQNTNTQKDLNPSKESTNRKENKKLEAQIRQEISQQTKPFQQKLKKAEILLDQLHEEKNKLESFLNDENAYQEEQKQILQTNLARLTEVKILLEKTEEEWLLLQEEISTRENEIKELYKRENL
ncbi:ATP-binding cassette domain-containing protein [Neisseria sp. Ec49-e6-T10]|uniref:ATP-binding cassette domain-containing protein n=1 Tax=Neisseria sp. Ec49-e6-T10 TaxID=3140744 RepID=UPI003EBFEA2F